MIYKKSKSEKVFNVCNILIMIFMMLICIYPIYYVAMCSISDPGLLVQHEGILLLPKGFTLNGYRLVLDNPNIVSGYGNTIMYTVLGTILNVFFSCLAAYTLTRKEWMFYKGFNVMIAITMFVSGGLIPTYIVVKSLGLLNTIWALLIPGVINAWNVIIMRTSFQQIPDSLEESATIDGANDLQVLFKIILPLSKPVIAVMFLFYAVGHWNSWFDASIYLMNRDLFPLQLILREILITNSTDSMLVGEMLSMDKLDTSNYKMLIQYSTIVIATAPILCIYPFLQKYFVKGIMVGAIKG